MHFKIKKPDYNYCVLRNESKCEYACICHMLDNPWCPGTTSWIEDSNATFWKQRTKWLLGCCFIILHLLVVLSELQFNVDVSIYRERGL